MIFEVCANSFQSAINAQKGGANRIELCAALEVGGITPSYGLIKQVAEQLTIPIHVLIRPRGGHFVYSDDEIEIMRKDIRFCKELGIDGVVIGMLTKEGAIDVTVLKELVKLARPMKVGFHRAFDRAKDPIESFKTLMDCGIDILLTSGQQPAVNFGLDLIAELVELSNGKIEVLPGGGITEYNAVNIVEKTKVQSIHFSVTAPRVDEDVFSKEQFEKSFGFLETGVDVVRRVVGRFGV